MVRGRGLVAEVPRSEEDDEPASGEVLDALVSRRAVGGLRRRQVLVCVPSDWTPEERLGTAAALMGAGAAGVRSVPTLIAAAVGAGVPVHEPRGALMVDLGAGRTEAGVVTLGGVATVRVAKVGGRRLNRTIDEWLERNEGLQVSPETLETLKVRIASLTPQIHADLRMGIRGVDATSGHPREAEVSSAQLSRVLQGPVQEMRRCVQRALADTAPELCGDILVGGVVLCGGTSRLRGLEDVLRNDTGVPVIPSNGPELCVAMGAAKLLEDAELLGQVCDRRAYDGSASKAASTS